MNIIKGKWNKNTYSIIGSLGRGGTARVFKVRSSKDNNIYALKISDDLHSITKECDMLTRFKHLKVFPTLIEMDDYIVGENTLYFIVIEYIDGCNVSSYFSKKKMNTKSVLELASLVGSVLKKLHKSGYIYGDLKPENIMYDSKNKEIRLIDLGGVVTIGKPIKEFTPSYDRAKWNMGNRLADEDYDMFSMSMLMITMLLNRSILKSNDINRILKALKNRKIDFEVVRLIEMGIRQRDIGFNDFIEKIDKLKNISSLKYRASYKSIDLAINILLSTAAIGFIIITILNIGVLFD